jgi:hypothetical protein
MYTRCMSLLPRTTLHSDSKQYLSDTWNKPVILHLISGMKNCAIFPNTQDDINLHTDLLVRFLPNMRKQNLGLLLNTQNKTVRIHQ